MYQFDVVSLFPEMFNTVFESGVTSRAIKEKYIGFRSWNPRHFTEGAYHKVDDRPYGGGPGMVMMYEPLAEAIGSAKNLQPEAKVVYLTPQGTPLKQTTLQTMSERSGVILVCGRYEGIDERIVSELVDDEYSIGDYVISGGELAAMVIIDGISRLLPGVLGHEDSAEQDSFVDGLLDYPHYTRPETIAGQTVPAELLNGNHEVIRKWRLKQALGKTWRYRPDLLREIELTSEQQMLLDEFIAENK